MDRQYLGDYELLKQINKGPLGILYHAQHRFLKRYYALRVLPEELAKDGQFIERFQQEVSKLSTLHHDNIAKIHNISHSEGKFFIVSDLILDEHGEFVSLGDYLQNSPKRLSEEEIFAILYQIAGALDYMHENKVEGQGCVHRYLNLQSILVGRHSEGALTVYLNDAGLAPIIGEGALISKTYQLMAEALALSSEEGELISTDATSTKLNKLHDSFLESYPFLSPEQKQMSRGLEVNEKADVYAFGILAYYMLMGSFPEGFFALPSSSDYQFQWDPFMMTTLNLNPSERPASLLSAMRLVREKTQELPTNPWNLSTQESKAPINPAVNEALPAAAKSSTQPASDVPTEVKVVNPTIKEIVAEIQEEKTFVTQPAAEAPQENSIESNISLKAQPQATRMHQEGGSTAVLESTEIANETITPKAVSATITPTAANATVTTMPHADSKPEDAQLKPVLKPAEIEKPQFEPDPAVVFHTDNVIAPYKPEEKESVDLQPIQTDMIVIPGGEFYRGSNEGARDEKPYHKISLDSFAIDTHPCTNEQFVRFIEVMGGEKDCNNNDMIRLRESRIKRSGGKLIIESGYSNHPVVGVTWYGAVAYAKWVGKRLPSEAEWEVAARSMKTNISFPTGDEIERDQANFFSSDTTPVMKYEPNELGLYDVAGNVYEWCEDWYDYAYYDASQIEPQNPKGPHQGVYRVLRGGCWKSLSDDLRCSHRHRNNPGSVNKTYGFRCAADVATNA